MKNRTDKTDGTNVVEAVPLSNTLPEECIEAMLRVYYGAYIYDIHIANLLTYVSIDHPEWIVIGEPSVTLDCKRRPIFAAILTPEGKEYVDAL